MPQLGDFEGFSFTPKPAGDSRIAHVSIEKTAEAEMHQPLHITQFAREVSDVCVANNCVYAEIQLTQEELQQLFDMYQLAAVQQYVQDLSERPYRPDGATTLVGEGAECIAVTQRLYPTYRDQLANLQQELGNLAAAANRIMKSRADDAILSANTYAQTAVSDLEGQTCSLDTVSRLNFASAMKWRDITDLPRIEHLDVIEKYLLDVERNMQATENLDHPPNLLRMVVNSHAVHKQLNPDASLTSNMCLLHSDDVLHPSLIGFVRSSANDHIYRITMEINV